MLSSTQIFLFSCTDNIHSVLSLSVRKKYLQDIKRNLKGKQQTFRFCQHTEWKPKTLALLSPLNSLILLLTGAYLFMLLHVILYGRFLSHAVPAYCLLVLPERSLFPWRKGVSQIPHTSTTTITSPDWFWRPKKGSFNDIVHLSHWLKVGGWEGGRYGKEVERGLLVGTGGEGYCWAKGWEHWGAGLTGGKKHSSD